MIKNIFSFAILLFSIGFLFLYVKPLYGLVERRRTDIELLHTALGQANSVKSVIEETGMILGSISPLERTRFNTFLPSTLDEIRFVNNIINIARTRSVVVENIKIEKSAAGTSQEGAGDTSAAGGLRRVFSLNKEDGVSGGNATVMNGAVLGGAQAVTTVSFSFVAPYTTVLLLLDDIEKSLGLINVNALSLKEYTEGGESAKSGVPRYHVTVEIETYSLK